MRFALLRPTGLRLTETFAEVRERAAGGAAKPARRCLRRLAASLEFREPGAELRELMRRQPQNRFFDVFERHCLKIARQSRRLNMQCVGWAKPSVPTCLHSV